jgi:hypothetical protein
LTPGICALPDIVGAGENIEFAMDLTDFDADNQAIATMSLQHRCYG